MTNILEHVTETCNRLVSKANIVPGYGRSDIELLRLMSKNLIQDIYMKIPGTPEISEITQRDLFLYSHLTATAFEMIHTIGEPDEIVLTFFEEIVILNISENHIGHFEYLQESFKDVYQLMYNSNFKKPLVTLSYKYNQLIGTYVTNRDSLVCFESKYRNFLLDLIKYDIDSEEIEHLLI